MHGAATRMEQSVTSAMLHSSDVATSSQKFRKDRQVSVAYAVRLGNGSRPADKKSENVAETPASVISHATM